MKHNKLVRDRIPEIIRANGNVPITHIADDQEYQLRLREKLIEEATEFFADPTLEELADVQEVVFALCKYLGCDRSELERARREKAEQRGRFQDRIILEETRER
ncbi:MAG: nucleoside triphosphate pyrophosphohydrolase [Candidatus Uhrbacteria bacterium]